MAPSILLKTKTWTSLESQIAGCELCPRLREHCLEIARIKRKAFLTEKYWGRPISGYGDYNARLVIIGLAPAAHGANRTGRVFTGDRSGDWLYRALHKAGFANQPTSVSRDDGLKLNDCFITATVKCAPPDNKPTLEEINRCSSYLAWELSHLKQARVFLALGKIGFDAIWDFLKNQGEAQGRRPDFGHDRATKLDSGRWLLASYHPSQQNTFTGKLTEPMFDSVFAAARRLL